jgi:tetratricopeptide (TPR) repeat protein
LAQRVLLSRTQDVTVILSPSSDFQSPEALASAVENHPLARAAHRLIALDLREYADPGQRAALLDRAIAQFNHGNDDDVAALARWLNGKGEHQRVIDSIAISQAQKSRDIFLQYLDALGALGRWTDIKRLLESAGFPLEPYLQAMYLARCNWQLGEKTAATNNWQRAVEAAAGDTVKLVQVAEFAGKNGVLDTADRAYAAALDQSPNLRSAYQGRLRIAQARRDTKEMHELLAAMLKLWPNDTPIQNDEAYTRLLLLPSPSPVGEAAIFPYNDEKSADELREIEKLAEQLVQREPKSLPHRTLLALARLRSGLPSSALDAYGIEVPDEAITPSAAAVRAAVLGANGRADEARSLIAKIPRDQFLPEERALIESGNQEARK